MIQEHFFVSGRCKWCGAGEAGTGLTCLERKSSPSAMRPEPVLRRISCEDSEAISARLAELRILRDEALNTPAKDDAG